jgi:hypothetical protein
MTCYFIAKERHSNAETSIVGAHPRRYRRMRERLVSDTAGS